MIVHIQTKFLCKCFVASFTNYDFGLKLNWIFTDIFYFTPYVQNRLLIITNMKTFFLLKEKNFIKVIYKMILKENIQKWVLIVLFSCLNIQKYTHIHLNYFPFQQITVATFNRMSHLLKWYIRHSNKDWRAELFLYRSLKL